MTYVNYRFCVLLWLLAIWGFFWDYLNATEKAKTYFRCDAIGFSGVFPTTDLVYYSQIIVIISNMTQIM